MAVARIRQWLTKEIEYKSGIACNLLNEIYRKGHSLGLGDNYIQMALTNFEQV